MSLKTYSVYIKSKCERYIVFMPSWGAKEVCQIIIHDAYDNLCTKENILGLQTAEPLGQSAEPPSHEASGPKLRASAFRTHRSFSTATEASQIYKQTPHRSNMLVTYEYKEVLPQF